MAVLYRNNQFTNEELKHAERFKSKFHSAAMAVISFYEVIHNFLNILLRNYFTLLILIINYNFILKISKTEIHLQVDFSYDRMYLLKHIRECSASLHSLIQRHLTGKSVTRINHVFDFFSNPQFLDAMFKKNSEYHEILGKIVADMNKALDSGDL